MREKFLFQPSKHRLFICRPQADWSEIGWDISLLIEWMEGPFHHYDRTSKYVECVLYQRIYQKAFLSLDKFL